jgi:RIO-like serine/threonine protein kinase
MLKCPRCGQKLQLAKAAVLTFRQRRILKAIEQGQRDLTRQTVPTSFIAAQVGVSIATAKNELAHLEDMENIHRPEGPKRGWAIHDDQGVGLIIAA